ncbi:MAG: hypothetical protein BAJALOKI2v1_80060 [Promethearchaeota archaeon]|nr:MAG: hypothetical protein BAJALOKI2v1_80060 [Candidatus Lokiarchaeota archaeon]
MNTSIKNKWKNLSKLSKILLILILILTPSVIIGLSSITISNPRKRTYMVEMRDGVTLATDIYLPKSDGPFPFILYRTPYGKKEAKGLAETLLQYDIGFAAQDHRGCHDSKGDYTIFGSDGQDALDTVLWMKEQPWFNGIYATQGGSARGITQYQQVPYLDDIQCQNIVVATPNLYDQGIFYNGVPRKMLAKNWLKGIDQGEHYEDIFKHPLGNDIWAREHRIDEWEWDNVTWPSIHTGGWYDVFCQGILDGFMGYQYKGGEGGAGNAKLIMGPWTHGINDNHSGELVYPNANSAPYATDLYEALFAEKLLRLTDYGNYQDYPNVIYYVMGDVTEKSDTWNRWATSEVYPIPYINQTWYFHSDNRLSSQKPVHSSSKNYIVDPTNPVETLGGTNLIGSNRGPYDQRPVETNRSDIIHFEYTVQDPIHLSGRIYSKLYVKSNCTDTDFTVKISDVYPDGRVMLICDGIARTRYREGRNKSLLMDGDKEKIYEINVDLWSTNYVFNTGHKIRVSISSSNYPRFDVNPNTGAEIKPFGDDSQYYHANNSIIIDPSYPSSMIFPIPLSKPNFI